jgi:hypothetical protein
MDLANKLLYFDIYSKTATFYYNNQEKIGSKFGLFLTIVHVVTSLIIIIYYLIIAIQRSDLKVDDSSIYAQEMPSLNVDSNNLYFAFGIEDPISSNRFIDETIYYPQILYIDRVKINGEFQTVEKIELPFDRCKEEDFGKNFQHFLAKGELNNSYCLKNFDYNLTFAGGYKYDKMTYIRIKIFPCKNNTKNNNHCKPQEVIDTYLSSGYFSILFKDLGLNPSNYSNPVLPTLQDIFTTIDQKIIRNFIINFGITEINTDTGLFKESIQTKKFLKFREYSDYFHFRDEQDYIDGNEICIIQLKLDDTITIQTRKYTKFSDIFPIIGGYMNLMHTIFSLFSLLINQFNLEHKIINAIFDFNSKENRMIFKMRSFDLESLKISNFNNNVIITSQKSLEKFKFDTKMLPRNNYKERNGSNNSNCNELNDSDSKKITDTQNNNNNFIKSINKNCITKGKKSPSIKSNKIIPKYNIFINDKEDKKKVMNFTDGIKLDFFDYIFRRNNKSVKKNIRLYNLGIGFYRKIMDVIHVFALLLITEKVLFNNNKRQICNYLKENIFMFNKNNNK